MVLEPIEVYIELDVNNYVRIKADIPVRDLIQVPVDLQIRKNIKLDTTINALDRISVNLNTSIPIDQKTRIRLFSGDLIKIKSRTQVNKSLPRELSWI